jgi:hypothetical protein
VTPIRRGRDLCLLADFDLVTGEHDDAGDGSAIPSTMTLTCAWWLRRRLAMARPSQTLPPGLFRRTVRFLVLISPSAAANSAADPPNQPPPPISE